MAESSSGTKVREAVAVFDDVSSLEAAVDDLRAAGFGQHDISLLAAHAAVERKLGHMYRRVEELEDDPRRRAPPSSRARTSTSARTGSSARSPCCRP